MAARLLGYVEALYAAREETRETNAVDVMNHARAIARTALSDARLECLQAGGALPRDADITALAFDSEDA